jgi:TPR repeat protein
MYQYGRGVVKDLVEAARLYKLAAEGGYALAQHNLGCCYSDDDGVEQDYVEAVRWFRAAAAQAHAAAQSNLGVCTRTAEVLTKTTSRPYDGAL